MATVHLAVLKEQYKTINAFCSLFKALNSQSTDWTKINLSVSSIHQTSSPLYRHASLQHRVSRAKKKLKEAKKPAERERHRIQFLIDMVPARITFGYSFVQRKEMVMSRICLLPLTLLTEYSCFHFLLNAKTSLRLSLMLNEETVCLWWYQPYKGQMNASWFYLVVKYS